VRDIVVVVDDILVVFLHYQIPASIPNSDLYYFSSPAVGYLDNSLAA